MIPLTARSVNILRKLGIWKKGPNNTYRITTPLDLKTIDQQKLQATKWSTRKNPYVEVEQKRVNSNKKIYIDLRASKARPAGYATAGTHFNFDKNSMPTHVDPITLEKRGYVLRTMQGKKARYRDEGNRQRRDTKARRYKQLLRFVNRTYGRYTEAQEVAFAWNNTTNVSDFVEALAVNEGIDRLYGARARLERKFINEPLRLPVGYRALRSIWRYGSSFGQDGA
jgi:hypothetical protein